MDCSRVLMVSIGYRAAAAQALKLKFTCVEERVDQEVHERPRALNRYSVTLYNPTYNPWYSPRTHVEALGSEHENVAL